MLKDVDNDTERPQLDTRSATEKGGEMQMLRLNGKREKRTGIFLAASGGEKYGTAVLVPYRLPKSRLASVVLRLTLRFPSSPTRRAENGWQFLHQSLNN